MLISYGADDEDAAFKLYMKSKEILAEGGFNLRKFVTNSTRLNHHMCSTEQDPDVSRISTKIVEVLRRPLKCLYPLEIVKPNQDKDVTSHNDSNQGGDKQPAVVTSSTKRPRRAATLRPEKWMKVVLQDNL